MLRVTLICSVIFFLLVSTKIPVDARYLPTRSMDDRLNRLRELLRDLSFVDRNDRPHSGSNPELGPETDASSSQVDPLFYPFDSQRLPLPRRFTGTSTN
ncbi:unnamed protein product [Bemisia tabaci]|uniref:Short neuropeptide F n=1 Tax=Bemisia tabaci TaxID=7038 RepID=A0A9P0CDE7_BEMTA|nr:PREDICTED: uncharacterized protein LOC109043810 [Bemisia tabaci]CAH0771344.1 unnamed protein product [Bemisia tabaci]